VGRGITLVVLLVGLPAGSLWAVSDARTAVEAFVARLADVAINDLVVQQTVTLYHPDGLHPQSTGEERLYLKMPQRQRLERVMEGQRTVRLAVGDRIWIRRGDGHTYEMPAGERRADGTHLLVPFSRSAADLLAEWRALGVRDDLSHGTRAAGRPVTVIGARPGETNVPAVWFDAERGVVRFVTRQTLPTGPALLDLTFSEHRPLPGGFPFPHRQEAFVGGKLVVLVIVRSVAVNTNPPDRLFDPDALARE
jgi:hypothetical protein